VAPFVDPSLNLSIVVCPECAHASVRRKHPISLFWSKARRIDTALSIILVQTILAGILIGLITGMIWALADTAIMYDQSAIDFAIGAFTYDDIETASGTVIVRQRDGLDIALLVTAALCAIAGVWLTATFAHHRFAKRWLCGVAALFVCVSLNWIGWGYQSLFASITSQPSLHGAVRFDDQFNAWIIRIALLLGCVVVMLAALPIGLPARWVLRIFRGALWRKQLRRARYAKGRDE